MAVLAKNGVWLIAFLTEVDFINVQNHTHALIKLHIAAIVYYMWKVSNFA